MEPFTENLLPAAMFLSALSLIASLSAFWLARNAAKKISLLFGGKKIKGGEELLQDAISRLVKAENKLAKLEPRLEIAEKISRISVQKVGFLRFNPFNDTGGDQSFVIAMLDRENNGVILSSLYAREGARIYAKNVERGKSKYPLSEEEKKVLEKTTKEK